MLSDGQPFRRYPKNRPHVGTEADIPTIVIDEDFGIKRSDLLDNVFRLFEFRLICGRKIHSPHTAPGRSVLDNFQRCA